MVKKIRRVRTFARTASKSMEKQVIENAKKIKDDPYLILPDYDDRVSAKYFDKVKKLIGKVNRFSDDSKKLEKISNKRGLEGAIAGTMLIALSEKAPYLGVAKIPTGEITYAQRGRAEKEKLIAVQHFDDPMLRLLGVKDIAIRRNLHIYSWDSGFVCTGVDPDPPKDFIGFVVKKGGFSKKNGIAYKGNIKLDEVKNKVSKKYSYLYIYWKSADLVFAISEDAEIGSKNSIIEITKYLVEPEISDDFSVEVIGQVVKGGDSTSELETQEVDSYIKGNISDIDFIKKNMKFRDQKLRDSGEKIFVLDGKSFGDNVEEFISALKPKKHEVIGLRFILDAIDEPVVVDDVTANKVLERFWKDHGLDAVISIIDDEDMSKKFFSLADTPSNILELVLNFKERQKILSQLPSYKSLPSLASFVDGIARTYKTFGEKEALAEIKKRPDTPKGKSISYSFLLVFGKGRDKKWQYSPLEIEYGEYLKDYAKKLIEARPEDYHHALQELLTASGSSENIDSYLS